MPSAQECLAIIQEAAGGEIPDDVLDELLTELQQRAEARRAANKLETVEEAFLNAADEVSAEVIEAAQIERRNRLINIKAFDRAMRQAAEADEQLADPSLALEAMMVGVNAPLRAGRLSVDARGNALLSEYMGGLIADLRRQNLLPLLNSRSLDREIARELAETSKRQGTPGVSGSDQAAAIARAIDKYRKVAVARENRRSPQARGWAGRPSRSGRRSVPALRAQPRQPGAGGADRRRGNDPGQLAQREALRDGRRDRGQADPLDGDRDPGLAGKHLN